MGRNPYPNRRKFVASLASASLLGVAGCTSDSGGDSSDEEGGGGASGGDEDTPTSTPTEEPTEPPEDEDTPTEEPTDTPTPEPFTDLVLADAQVVTIERSYDDRVGGQVRVTNEGDAMTAQFTVGMDWLDENGEYIATSDLYGLLLEQDETWIARQPAFLDVDEPENVGGVEATVTDEADHTEIDPYPDDIELTDETIRTSDEEVVARGVIENNRDTSEFIEVAAKALDGDGNVIGMDRTIEEVDSGDTWRFELNPRTYGRTDQVEDGTIIPYVE